MYKEELKDYLNHCKSKGIEPKFHYLRFLKQFYQREEKEWQKTLERIYGKNKFRKLIYENSK